VTVPRSGSAQQIRLRLRAIAENDRLARPPASTSTVSSAVSTSSAPASCDDRRTAGYWLSYINARGRLQRVDHFQMSSWRSSAASYALWPDRRAAFLTLVSEFLGTRFVYHT